MSPELNLAFTSKRLVVGVREKPLGFKFEKIKESLSFFLRRNSYAKISPITMS